MKISFVLLLLCISCVAFAQRKPYSRDSLLKRVNLINPVPNNQATYSHTLPNGNAVYILPQDNMPCVIPDPNGLAKMPNVWNGVTVPYRPQYHPIPNPALPNQSFKYNLNMQADQGQTK